MAAPFSDADLVAVAQRPAADIAIGDQLPAWLSKSVVEGVGIDPRGVDLDDVVVRMWCYDEPRMDARSGNEEDGHWTSLASLAAELDGYGLDLEPDQKVITGALARFVVASGEQWRASFDSVGNVVIRAR
jgi:hypothetical protein